MSLSTRKTTAPIWLSGTGSKFAAAALSLLFLLPCAVSAADYDEADSGDLSDDPSVPTLISVEPGNNSVRGRVTDFPLDRDFFTLLVPPETAVTGIELDEFQLLSLPSDGGMLVALEPGSEISDLGSSDALRGFVIAGVADGTREGEELLDDLGGGTLGPGRWTFWLQNTGSVTSYDLNVTAATVVPPPPVQRPAQSVPTLGPLGGLLLVGGLLALAFRTRHRL